MARAVTAYTSVNLAYLSQAIVLRDSLRRHHPDIPLILILVDERPEDEALARELGRFDQVLLAADLGVAKFRGWMFEHQVVEACTAVKGAALVTLLSESEKVLYLDPDMAVLGALDPVIEALDAAPLVLTPHLLTAELTRAGVKDNEIGTLLTGIYNLGFFGVANHGDGPRFASWWRDRLHDHCFDDAARGLFTDQKWVDLAPVFFPDARVVRDPGFNVASWNLSGRIIELDARGEYTVNGSPLRLFHFTKATTVGPTMTSRYAYGNPRIFELWRWYLERLNHARSNLPTVPWAYGHYENGEPVDHSARRLYRDRADLRGAFPDPFKVGDGSLHQWIAAQRAATRAPTSDS